MFSRRSFFSKVAAMAAAVALAPEIAFGTTPYSCIIVGGTKSTILHSQRYDVLCDRETADLLRAAMVRYWHGKHPNP